MTLDVIDERMPHINALIEWALDNLADILNDRKKFSSNKKH